MKNLFLAIFLLFTIPAAYAQNSPQGWLIYFGNTKLKDSKFSIHHELQLRDHQLGGDHNQTLIRAGLEYAANPLLSLTAGYGFIYNEADGTPNAPFVEHRIYQEAMFKHNFERINLRHRFRLEERFIENTDFRGRGRYCLFVDVPFNMPDMDKGALYVVAYNEVFLNIADDTNLDVFDRNRLYGGIGYKLKANLALQLGYMRQNVEDNKGTNHILLSAHHRLKWN